MRTIFFIFIGIGLLALLLETPIQKVDSEFSARFQDIVYEQMSKIEKDYGLLGKSYVPPQTMDARAGYPTHLIVGENSWTFAWSPVHDFERWRRHRTYTDNKVWYHTYRGKNLFGLTITAKVKIVFNDQNFYVTKLGNYFPVKC